MARKQKPPDKGNPGPLLERDGLISSEELATFLGVAVTTLDQWSRLGKGPTPRRVGIYRKYMPADVRAWLGRMSHEAGREPCPKCLECSAFTIVHVDGETAVLCLGCGERLPVEVAPVRDAA